MVGVHIPTSLFLARVVMDCSKSLVIISLLCNKPLLLRPENLGHLEAMIVLRSG